MRKRFRGNQPMAVSKEIEGGSGGSGQLYAGGKAVGEGSIVGGDGKGSGEGELVEGRDGMWRKRED